MQFNFKMFMIHLYMQLIYSIDAYVSIYIFQYMYVKSFIIIAINWQILITKNNIVLLFLN